jgi:hypothetical protein
MAYSITQTKEGNDIIIDGFENGISASPYTGIANIRNLNTYYYPKVAYVNYARQACAVGETGTTYWYAGTHSTNVSDNTGWIFTAQPAGVSMTNPVQKATSPAGLNYILDDSGQVWKQSAVNSSTFNALGNGGRFSTGSGGIAYWNNYIVVFGNGLIEFCGDGTGDSTIISGNWNKVNYNASVNNVVFTTAYGGGNQIIFNAVSYPLFTVNDPVQFSTTGTLPAPLVASTTYYISQVSAGNIYVSTGIGDNAFTAGVSSGATSAILAVPFSGTTGSYQIIFSDLETKNVTLTNNSTAVSWTGGLSNSVNSTVIVSVILTSNGTGVQTITDYANPLPMGNCTNLVWGVGTVGSTTLTITSYVNTVGATVKNNWLQATGQYFIVMPDGEKLYASFTYGSNQILLAQPLVYYPTSGTWNIELINASVSFYRPYVSKVSGNLLFCNGVNIGQILYVPTTNSIAFNPSLVASEYTVSTRVATIPVATDTVVDMVDLKGVLIVLGQQDAYTWDYLAANMQAPFPVGEQNKSIFNVLNVIYILAGQKGNIYVSNGYSAQLLQHLPDYISGVIDPVWSWGGVMSHRSRLFFQAMAQDTSGNNLLAGVFSLQVSPGLLGEQSAGLNMENQNSYGLIPPVGSLSNGVLIDNQNSSSGQDSYYSAWSNGASSGGIDYNNTTLYQNNEPVIETDIIPIGNYLIKKTLGSIEFKLDRPLATGDSVALYWRPSLSDAWVSIRLIDTATGLMSNYGISAINQAQWSQFKITFSCASSGSSRIPFRELRLHLTP